MHNPETASTKIIADNWQCVLQDVASACEAARRDNDVTIVGVSKYVGPEWTLKLIEAGCENLGENRPQALWAKFDWLQQHQLPQPQWHMIGHLQRNKVRRTLPMISCLHSVDSLRLARCLSEEAVRHQSILPVFAEVNVTDNADKTGMLPSDLLSFFEVASELPALDFQGLMAMSSQFTGGEQARREFARVRQLRDTLQERFPTLKLHQLSMGMSGDFREAIAEGATMVRIGSRLWQGIEL